jgi:hypothetical protein
VCTTLRLRVHRVAVLFGNRVLGGLTAVLVALVAPAAGAQVDSSCIAQLTAFRSLSPQATAADSAHVRAPMESCIDQWDGRSKDSLIAQTHAEALRLVKMFLEIPEFHDEGRLPAGNDARGPILGPFAGIFASPFLHGFTRPGQIYEQGMPGLLAALVVVDSQKGDVIPQSYKRLHLANGLNCVWLYLPPPPKGPRYLVATRDLPFRAYVSHPGAGMKCDRNGAMSQALSVAPIQSPAFPGESACPAVGRFDVDGDGNPVLGFKCLDAFCEIGTTRARRPSHIPPGNANVPQGERRVSVIKGWHDEQVLAIRDQYGTWRPSGVGAIIKPEPAAAAYDASDFDHQWRKVATIWIHDLPETSKYAKVWKLANGANEVWYQFDGKDWKAEIRRRNFRHPWRYMKRTFHHDVAVPATVRFRWTGLDDGVWAPCGNACCKAADGS